MANQSAPRSSVHVPPCSSPACQPFLQQIQAMLQEHGVSCCTSYEPGGLYHQRFQQAFSESTCTVIHVCSEIIRKMKRVEAVLKSDPSKAWFIQVEPPSCEADKEFLLDFNIVDLCTQDKQHSFLGDLLTRLGTNASNGNTETSPNQAGDGAEPYTTTPSGVAAQDRQRAAEAEKDFQTFTKVFRGGTASAVHVHKSFLSLDPSNLTASARDFAKIAREHVPLRDVVYLSQVVLPDLHAQGDIVALSHLACSHQIQLRLHALHLICMLLLEQTPTACSTDKLQTAELLLFTSIEEEFKQLDIKQGTGFLSERLGCTEFLAFVYLAVVVVYVLKEDTSRGTNFLENILQRPLFHIKRQSPSIKKMLQMRISQHSSPVPGWYKAMKSCLRVWSTSRLDRAKKLFCTRRQGDINSQSLWRSAPAAILEHLFPMLVASLVKSFRDSEPVFTTFLQNFQPSVRKSSSDTWTTLQRMITSFYIFGLTSFLQHRSEKLSSSENFLAECGHSVDSLSKLVSRLDRESQISCNFQMTTLLFSTNKAVRQHTGFLLRQQSFYHEYLWEMLLLETTLITWPLLDLHYTRREKKSNGHQSWTVIKSTFSEHNVLTHVHKPTATHQLRFNRTEDKSILQGDQYFRELGFLKQLKHPNILQLIAFHDACCPQFYATENYMAAPLQSVLVNKSRNGHHFSVKRLLTMLVEVLEGIQYCHDNGIVHRDLTAANLFITSDDRVKLAGFKHALKLCGKLQVRDFELSFMATRWSAPESHQHCCFSLASDMWMVGHLMYEILTHGRLPYSDVHRTDEELMPMVVRGEKTLCGDPCIPRSVQSLIQNLCSVREVERNLSASHVASKVRSVMESGTDSLENLSRYFADLSSDEQAATRHAKGPILSLIDDFPGITVPDIMEDKGGYQNCGPKKGPIHFVEPCPSSFSNEEWTVLSQEDLPGITKLIGRPNLNPAKQRVLPFVVPATSLCSVKDAVLGRWLGKELEPYMLCLQQLANHLCHLHARGIILCDFSPETIHVERLSDNNRVMKVWVTSLPQIKVLPEGQVAREQDSHINLHAPHEPDQCRRAAPEVLQHGQYSPASDVYCFSMLVWWVFNAFDVSAAGAVSNSGDLSPLDTVPVKKIYENVIEGFQGPLLPRPDCCPKHLYRVLKESWQSQTHLRPSMRKMMKYLTIDETHITGGGEGNDGYEEVGNIANPSDVDSLSERSIGSTQSTGSRFNVRNPSEFSDVDSVSGDSLSSLYLSGPVDRLQVGNPSLRSAESEVEQQERCDSDEEVYLELGEDTRTGRKEVSGPRAEEEQHPGRTAAEQDSHSSGGDEKIYKNDPHVASFPRSALGSSDVLSDEETYDELDTFSSPASVPQPRRDQPSQSSADPDGGGVYMNSPTPPPLPPRNPKPTKSFEDLRKPSLLSAGVFLATRKTSSLDTSKIEGSRSGPPPLPPPRCVSSGERQRASDRLVRGTSHTYWHPPPTPPIQRQLAFDSDNPPLLVAPTASDTEYKQPVTTAVLETEPLSETHSETGSNTHSAIRGYTIGGVPLHKPVLLVKSFHSDQFVPEHSASRAQEDAVVGRRAETADPHTTEKEDSKPQQEETSPTDPALLSAEGSTVRENTQAENPPPLVPPSDSTDHTDMQAETDEEAERIVFV